MIIVAGTIEVAPEDRSQFLELSEQTILTTRGEKGCIAYSYSADSIDAGRIILFEIWESVEDLEAHLVIRRSSLPVKGRPAAIERKIVRYEISAWGPNQSGPQTS